VAQRSSVGCQPNFTKLLPVGVAKEITSERM
jgi:hypothetical protein